MADEPLNNEQEQAQESAPEQAAEGGGDDWAAALAEQEPAGGPEAPSFDELGEGVPVETGGGNLDFLLDVPLEVSVELGRTNMIINKMLQLTQGSVVELDKAAGEPVEIYVNRKLMGKGEVVVINDRFGVRITEIISQADRIKNMG